jgi:ABC-type transporter Mla subunit MlaD
MGNWDQVSKVYNTAMNSAGSITEEVNNRLEAGQTQVDRFSAAWENLAVAIGDRFRDNVTEAITSATDLVDAIQTGIQDGALDSFFAEIGDMAHELAGYLDEIAAVMPQALEGVDWSGLADAVRGVGDAFKEWFEGVDLTTTEGLSTAIQDLADGTAKLIGLFETLVAMADDIAGFGADVGAVAQEIVEHSTATEDAAYNVRDLGVASRKTSPQAEKLANALSYAKQRTSDASNEMDQFNQYLNYNTRNTHKSREALGELQYVINTLTGKQLIVGAEADKESARKAGQEAKDQVPKETKMKVEAEVKKDQIEKDIAQIEASAEKVQKAMEMEAKVNVAQVEAGAERAKAAFESVSTSVQDTSKNMETLFGFLQDPGPIFSPSFYRDVQDMIADEHESRQKLLQKQAQLTEQQIKLMKQKLDSMRDGEGLIKIEGQGLEPELEAFMWKIVERIQLRVNEQSAEYLLGIGSA